MNQQEQTKIVRSKDVLAAIENALKPLKRQQLPAGEVGMLIYQKLSSVPEFQVASDLLVSDAKQIEQQR